MMKLFKSMVGSLTAGVSASVATVGRTDLEIVEQIHKEFDTAQERLLEQANRIIAEKTAKPEMCTVEDLEKLGFVKSRSVVKLREDRGALIMGLDLATKVMYYQKKYPTLKFVNEAELDRICQKYGLIYAPVSAYTGEVPEKNIREIKQAPALGIDDRPSDTLIFKYTDTFTDEATETQKKELIKGIKVPESVVNANRGRSALISFHEITEEYFGVDYNVCRYGSLYGEIKTISRGGLFIAAPKSDFDLTDVKQTSEFGHSFVTVAPKDPIVFRYVRGGIQVLSKWGLEANDPELTNAIDN